MKKSAALGIALVFAMAVSGGTAAMSREQDSDHERARRAFESGELLPITQILAIVSQHLPGDVIEVELDVGRDHIYYEVDVLTATGRVREIVVDGRTGAIIKIDG